LKKEGLDDEYMGLYALGRMINDPLYGQISYNSSLSNAFNSKLRHNVKLCLIDLKAATGKNIAEHVMRLAKVIPASLVMVSDTPLLFSELKLRGYLMKMIERWMKWQGGKRVTAVLM
jgi:hypothetical protein